MNSELMIALMSLAGTVVGSLSGVLAANRLTNYRIQELEKRWKSTTPSWNAPSGWRSG